MSRDDTKSRHYFSTIALIFDVGFGGELPVHQGETTLPMIDWAGVFFSRTALIR